MNELVEIFEESIIYYVKSLLSVNYLSIACHKLRQDACRMLNHLSWNLIDEYTSGPELLQSE